MKRKTLPTVSLKPEKQGLTEAELIDTDVEEPDRPVLFNFRNGKRLQANQSKSLEKYDIQSDRFYCPWCGKSNAVHYSPFSQWLPCRAIR